MTGEHISPARWQQTIPELFAAQVRERPEAVAVSCGPERLSYAELDSRAERIAGWLAAQGVGVEDVVAVQMARSVDLVAALLGIVKCGAAYLALETDTPPARGEQLLAAVEAAALVTDGGRASRGALPTLELPDGLAGANGTRPGRGEARPDNLAYVCFTSGSTGRPKAVGVPHHAVARLVGGDYAAFGPGQVFVLVSAVSFDASTFEIWGALLTGARLLVHPPGPLDADELARLLAGEDVTTLFLTTALFHRLVDRHLDALGGLAQLLTGGEVVNPDHVNRFVNRFPSVRLIHAYGPTENTTFTTCDPISEPVGTAYVPMGRPITGTEIRVLNPALAPAEPGDEGELYAAGAGLSRGYLRDPRTTATAFVPDPFAADAGARMYRTGDLVRRVSPHELEFLGRADRQAKIRGFRVEPAEVERELTALPDVSESLVLVRQHETLGKTLVAYVVADRASDGDPRQLARVRGGLRASLPAHMIPSGFVVVDELPLNKNGKIDLAALPPLERAARRSDTEYEAPRSATEQLLSDLWAELLGLECVGVSDDFFELGGNSLLAIDLVERMDVAFDVELPVRTLFENPTVAEFAAAVGDLISPQESRDEDHDAFSVGARAAG